MKRLLLPILAISSMLFFWSAATWSSSSPGAKTGSPADGAACTQCHNGTASNQSGWITTNIPPAGYIGGQTYTITLNGTHSGVVKMGFECTAEDVMNNKTGSFTITNSSETQLVNNNAAVTHTNAGTTPSGGSKSWSFNWTAPAGGTGAVTFYAAVNAANGNGITSGDQIYLTNLTVNELSTTLASVENMENSIEVYPSPAKDRLWVNRSYFQVQEYRIFSANGQLLKEINNTSNDQIVSLNIEDLEAGLYFLQIISTDAVIAKSFMKR